MRNGTYDGKSSQQQTRPTKRQSEARSTPGHRAQVPSRLLSLDVIRGIALCGIAFPNVISLWRIDPDSRQDNAAWLTQELLAHQRFFPVFTFLFGVGFSMITASARRKGANEAAVLARRLGTLPVLGLIHKTFQPGEALTVYAVCALVLLEPLTFIRLDLRRKVALLLGVVLTAVGTYFGGVLLVPGLLLLGFAAAEFGFPPLLDQDPRPARRMLLVTLPLALILSWFQYVDRIHSGFSFVSALAGLAVAVSWVCLIYVLLRSPLRSALGTMFSPLGRMALTNYLGATIILLVSRPMIGLPAENPDANEALFLLAFSVVLLMLLVQWVFSHIWLRKFSQGPLEYLWRRVTWMGSFQRGGSTT